MQALWSRLLFWSKPWLMIVCCSWVIGSIITCSDFILWFYLFCKPWRVRRDLDFIGQHNLSLQKYTCYTYDDSFLFAFALSDCLICSLVVQMYLKSSYLCYLDYIFNSRYLNLPHVRYKIWFNNESYVTVMISSLLSYFDLILMRFSVSKGLFYQSNLSYFVGAYILHLVILKQLLELKELSSLKKLKPGELHSCCVIGDCAHASSHIGYYGSKCWSPTLSYNI